MFSELEVINHLLTLEDSLMKTLMYFFLQNYSFLEISFTLACIPKFLVSIVTMDKIISYDACVSQLLFLIFLGASEFFLMAAMSYDCYVAICKPLHYANIMSSKVCTQLVLGCWLSGLFTISPGLVGLGLEFCDANIIGYFFGDYSLAVKVSCTDMWDIEFLSFILVVVTHMITLTLVLFSCVNIIRTILKIPSAQQRKQAFSTCSYHMIVISISYGSFIFTYIKPSAQERVYLNKGVEVLITSIAPVLNSFYIYSKKEISEKSPEGYNF